MNGRLLAAAIIAACGALFANLDDAHARRVALIIANQGYADAVGPLANPHNDARLLARALSRHGFEVMQPVLDARTRGVIVTAVEDFASRLDALGPGAVGFFYYAGHGLGRPGTRENYLLPVGLVSMEARTVWADSVRLEEVSETLNRIAPQAQHIIVFDACREELRLGRGAGRGASRGFEPVLAAGGTLTAYSTVFNEVAEDGEAGAGAGPYAAALAAELDRAACVSAEEVFGRVRRRFFEARSTQRPYYTNQLNTVVTFGEDRCGAGDESLVGSGGETSTQTPCDGVDPPIGCLFGRE